MGIWAILAIGAAVTALIVSKKKPAKAALPTPAKTKRKVGKPKLPSVPQITATEDQIAPAIPYTAKEKAVVAKVMKSKIPDPQKKVIAKLAQIAASPPTVTSKAQRDKAKQALRDLKKQPDKISELPVEERLEIAKAAIETIPPTPEEAAEALRLYIQETKSYGSKARPDATIKRCQKYMKYLAIDGIAGPKTLARAAALGYPITPIMGKEEITRAPSTAIVRPSVPRRPTLPARVITPSLPKVPEIEEEEEKPAAKIKKKIKPKPPKPKATVELKEPETEEETEAMFTEAAKAEVIEPETRSPKEAADDLKKHILATRSYGTKAKPDQTVMAAQRDMGGIAADGIYGPATRSRAAQLGVTLPPRK
jgi:hypothetical protein